MIMHGLANFKFEGIIRWHLIVGSYFKLMSTNKFFLLRSEIWHRSKWQFLLPRVLWFAVLPSVARISFRVNSPAWNEGY